jgi:hypothetical protein
MIVNPPKLMSRHQNTDSGSSGNPSWINACQTTPPSTKKKNIKIVPHLIIFKLQKVKDKVLKEGQRWSVGEGGGPYL